MQSGQAFLLLLLSLLRDLKAKSVLSFEASASTIGFFML